MKSFSGTVRLRENLDDELLHKELEDLGISGAVVNITNPWYYRKKDTGSWIKIGESNDMEENGPYEVLGLMHVSVLDREIEHIIARQNIVEVSIHN